MPHADVPDDAQVLDVREIYGPPVCFSRVGTLRQDSGQYDSIAG